MKLDNIQDTKWILLFGVLFMFVSSIPQSSYAATTINTKQMATTEIPKQSKVIKEDYFISADTVIIGCTSGMSAGILVGSVPVAGAIMSGIGLPESISLLINMAGMGCGVGAVSGAVAILTAWMLQPD